MVRPAVRPLPPAQAAVLALIPACWAAWNFVSWMPIPQGWADISRCWFVLAPLDLAFHEGGHVISIH